MMNFNKTDLTLFFYFLSQYLLNTEEYSNSYSGNYAKLNFFKQVYYYRNWQLA